MKATLLSILLCSLFIFSCTTNKNTIKGSISGLQKGDKIFLTIGDTPHNSIVIDSIVAETDDTFSIETPITGTYAHIFVIKEGDVLDLENKATSFFIEDFSKINIDGDIDNISYAKVTGGIYAMQEMSEINKMQDSCVVIQKMSDDKQQHIQHLKESNSSQDSIDKVQEEMTQLLEQLNDMHIDKIALCSNFREENPDFAYSALALSYDAITLMTKGIEHYKTLYDKLTPNVKASLAGVSLGEFITANMATNIGATTPNFRAKDILGEEISISDFKGKYLFIEFWSTSCGPCLQATPYIVEMYQKLKGDNFEILSIAINERNGDHLRKVITNKKMVWRHINDKDGEIKSKYGVQALPECILIDPNGKVVDKGHPMILIPKVEGIIGIN